MIMIAVDGRYLFLFIKKSSSPSASRVQVEVP